MKVSPELEMKLETMPAGNSSPSPNMIELCRRVILDLNPCSKQEHSLESAERDAFKICQAYSDAIVDHALRHCATSRLDAVRKAKAKMLFDGSSRIVAACEAAVVDRGGRGVKLILRSAKDLPSLTECFGIVPNYGAGIDRGNSA